jgi:trimethylamine:corrinoid methyltransferase-like protein
VNVSYQLAGGLNPVQLQKVRELTQSILWDIGIEVDHPQILAHLAAQEGVRIRGKRVCFDGTLVERCLQQQRAQNSDYVWQWAGEPDFVTRPAYMCLNTYDPVTGTVSRAALNDLAPAVKLCDSYGMAGTCPIHPQDLPGAVRQIATAKVCIENSRSVGKWMVTDNLEEIRCITEMSKLAGRTPPFVTLQITISPLRLNVEYLDIIWRLRNEADFADGITIGGGAIPMLGATGPLGLPAAWAQAAAEAIGSYLVVKLIDARVAAHACLQILPFDLRSAVVAMGTPEGALARLVGKQIQQHLFGRVFGSTFGSMGLPLDAQSTAERTANVLLEALAGARVFYDVGMAPGDDLFCLEQVVLDHEILGWVRRCLRGFDFNDDNEASLRAIRAGLADGGSFLMHEWTLGHREFNWTAALFSHEGLATWLAGSRESLAERARQIVQQRLAAHRFTLPDDVTRDIQRVYTRAAAKLGR